METKICSKCKEELPATNQYFSKNKRNKDGYECQCKRCMNKWTDWSNIIMPLEGYKICLSCKEEYPANNTYFCKTKDNKSELQAHCKKCKNNWTEWKFIKIAKKGYKICRNCKQELLLIDNFYKNKNSYDGLCKECRIKQQIKNKKQFVRKINYDYIYDEKILYECKTCHNKLPRTPEYFYRLKNSKDFLNYKCKICCRKVNKTYKYKANSDTQKLYNNSYVKCNSKLSKQIQQFIEVKYDENNTYIMTQCAYCGQWFTPTNSELREKLKFICKGGGVANLYCNNTCKQACPTYKKYLYPAGYKINTSREVQPELRKLRLLHDNYECQICGKNQNEVELHCHHIEGIYLNPIESADIDACITLCAEHHKQVHKLPNCSYNDLRCK